MVRRRRVWATGVSFEYKFMAAMSFVTFSYCVYRAGLLTEPEIVHRGSVLRFNDLDTLALENAYRWGDLERVAVNEGSANATDDNLFIIPG